MLFAACCPRVVTDIRRGRCITSSCGGCAGFQTHTTPVLLSTGERAELGTEKYVALSPMLEGIVILKCATFSYISSPRKHASYDPLSCFCRGATCCTGPVSADVLR